MLTIRDRAKPERMRIQTVTSGTGVRPEVWVKSHALGRVYCYPRFPHLAVQFIRTRDNKKRIPDRDVLRFHRTDRALQQCSSSPGHLTAETPDQRGARTWTVSEGKRHQHCVVLGPMLSAARAGVPSPCASTGPALGDARRRSVRRDQRNTRRTIFRNRPRGQGWLYRKCCLTSWRGSCQYVARIFSVALNRYATSGRADRLNSRHGLPGVTTVKVGGFHAIAAGRT